jgi:hypothetical protein
MGMGLGMRGKDLRVLLQVADQFGVIILMRQTNEASLKYVGTPGFYPKPAILKAKTADKDPPQQTRLIGGVNIAMTYRVAGLVVHPGFQPNVYREAKMPKAQKSWDDTMAVLAPTLKGKRVDLTRPDTWTDWGKEHQSANGSSWHWRVDIDPSSVTFGCIQLSRDNLQWSYIHGDYDLKDVIVVGHETDNRRREANIDGLENYYFPLLEGLEFEEIRRELNVRMGVDMIQHGAEAQYFWHGDEAIIVAYPKFRHVTLLSAETVQIWYRELNRKVLAAPTHNYIGDPSRMFHAGPEGTFKPGADPMITWGQ